MNWMSLVIRGGGHCDAKRLVGSNASTALPELAASTTPAAAGDRYQDREYSDSHLVVSAATNDWQTCLVCDIRPAPAAALPAGVDCPDRLWQEIHGRVEERGFFVCSWGTQPSSEPGMEVVKHIWVAGQKISHRSIIHA